jgi:hypothetical protein
MTILPYGTSKALGTVAEEGGIGGDGEVVEGEDSNSSINNLLPFKNHS